MSIREIIEYWPSYLQSPEETSKNIEKYRKSKDASLFDQLVERLRDHRVSRLVLTKQLYLPVRVDAVTLGNSEKIIQLIDEMAASTNLQALSIALNTVVSDNNVAERFCDFLRSTTRLNRLALSPRQPVSLEESVDNESDQYVEMILSALSANRSLETFTLDREPLRDDYCQMLAHWLQNHSKLTRLTLNSNHINLRSANHLAEGLKANKTLKHFDLDNQPIDWTLTDENPILKALSTQKSITFASLEGRVLPVDQVAHTIRHNNTLQTFSVKYSSYSADEWAVLVEAMKLNTTLLRLHSRVVMPIVNADMHTNVESKQIMQQLELLLKRNVRLQPKVVSRQIIAITMALYPLHLPPYVVLEIIDRLEDLKLVEHVFKIKLIIAVSKSCASIEDNKSK